MFRSVVVVVVVFVDDIVIYTQTLRIVFSLGATIILTAHNKWFVIICHPIIMRMLPSYSMRFVHDRNGNKRIPFSTLANECFHAFECRMAKKKKIAWNMFAFCEFTVWIRFCFWPFSGLVRLFILSRLDRENIYRTYPMSGLAPARSWLFVQVSVTLFSVTLTTRGVPGIDGNVLESGVRCRFTLPLFSTWNKQTKHKNNFDYFRNEQRQSRSQQ